MITYKPIEKSTSIRVLLDGKVAGTIRNEHELGYRYIPRAGVKHGGDYFPTLEACKRSLESDDDESTATEREG